MPKRGKISIGDLNETTAETIQKDVGPAAEMPSPQPDNAATSASETQTPEYEPSPRRPRTEREDAFDVGSWLLDGVVGIAEELRHNDLGLPEEFWVHAYAARKEALLAARSLIDVALEHCDQAQSPPGGRKKSKQRGSVDINFS